MTTSKTTKSNRRANISWITEDLATGGDFSFYANIARAQVADLILQDVQCVIDCRIEADDFETWTQYNSVRYHWLPINDSYNYNVPRDHFDRAVLIARQAAREGRKVFVHCHMGINRGPSTAFAILLDRGMAPDDAFDLIRAQRPQAGLAYAEDALRAHLFRQDGQVDCDVMDSFITHLNDVMTPDVQEGIEHIMRNQHKVEQVARRA